MGRQIIQREIRRFTCDVCDHFLDSSEHDRCPDGWRRVSVVLDGRTLRLPWRAPQVPVEIACCNPCIARFIQIYVLVLETAWGEPQTRNERAGVCEQCSRHGDCRWVQAQLDGENEFAALSVTARGSERSYGTSLCSLPCATQFLEACAREWLERAEDLRETDLALRQRRRVRA